MAFWIDVLFAARDCLFVLLMYRSRVHSNMAIKMMLETWVHSRTDDRARVEIRRRVPFVPSHDNYQVNLIIKHSHVHASTP